MEVLIIDYVSTVNWYVTWKLEMISKYFHLVIETLQLHPFKVCSSELQPLAVSWCVTKELASVSMKTAFFYILYFVSICLRVCCPSERFTCGNL